MVPADAKAWQVNPPPTQKEQGHTREQNVSSSKEWQPWQLLSGWVFYPPTF